jgi:hypothetical protein
LARTIAAAPDLVDEFILPAIQFHFSDVAE